MSVPGQSFSNDPRWGQHESGGSSDGDREAPDVSACRLDLPPVSVLLQRALQLPIQRQVRHQTLTLNLNLKPTPTLALVHAERICQAL